MSGEQPQRQQQPGDLTAEEEKRRSTGSISSLVRIWETPDGGDGQPATSPQQQQEEGGSSRPASVVKFEKRVWPPVPSTETEKPMVPVKPTVKPPPPTSKPPPPREPSCKPPPKPLPASKPLVCNIYAAPNSLGGATTTASAAAMASSKPNISVVRTKAPAIGGATAAAGTGSGSSCSATGADGTKSPRHSSAAAHNGSDVVKLSGKAGGSKAAACDDRPTTVGGGDTDGQTTTTSWRSETRANSTDSGLSSAACDRESLLDLSQSLQNLLAGLEQEITTQAAMALSDQVSVFQSSCTSYMETSIPATARFRFRSLLAKLDSQSKELRAVNLSKKTGNVQVVQDLRGTLTDIVQVIQR